MKEGEVSPKRKPYSSGNCTNLQNFRSAFEQTCPSINVSEFYIRPGLDSFTNFTGMPEEVFLKKSVNGLQRLQRSIPFFEKDLGVKIGDETEKRFRNEFVRGLLHEKCAPHVMNILCEEAFVRCNYANCSKLVQERISRIHQYFEMWDQCGVEQCSELLCINDEFTRNAAQSYIFKSFEEKLEQADDLHRYVDRLWATIRHESFRFCLRTLSCFRKTNLNRCAGSHDGDSGQEILGDINIGVEEDIPLHSALDSSDTILNCNPFSRNVGVRVNRPEDDSRVALVVIFSILQIIIIVSRKSPPFLHFKSTADRNARIVSAFLGIISGGFVFLGGQTYEKAGNDALAKTANTNNSSNVMYAWATIYFFVSWFCIHRSLTFIVKQKQTLIKVRKIRGHQSLDTTSIRHKCLRFGSCFAIISARLLPVNYSRIWRHFTSTRGKYNVLFFLFREVTENIVQFAGILQSSKVLGIYSIRLCTHLLCLNLILLPVVALCSLKGSRYWPWHVLVLSIFWSRNLQPLVSYYRWIL